MVEVTMPPTMGAAIGFMTSEPIPGLGMTPATEPAHRIGEEHALPR
jgi:hypothetical protein